MESVIVGENPTVYYKGFKVEDNLVKLSFTCPTKPTLEAVVSIQPPEEINFGVVEVATLAVMRNAAESLLLNQPKDSDSGFINFTGFNWHLPQLRKVVEQAMKGLAPENTPAKPAPSFSPKSKKPKKK